jgi:hypothetical protein
VGVIRFPVADEPEVSGGPLRRKLPLPSSKPCFRWGALRISLEIERTPYLSGDREDSISLWR